MPFCTKKTVIVSIMLGTLAIVVAAAVIGIVMNSKKLTSWVNALLRKEEIDIATCFKINNNFTRFECPPPEIVKIDNIDAFDYAEDENRISIDRHVIGVRPVHYNWTINFLDRENYTGRIDLTVKIVSDTNRVVLNADNQSMAIDFQSINIVSCSKPDEKICVEKITVIGEQLIAVDFKQTLQSKRLYTLTFGRLAGAAYSDLGGGKGLRLTSFTEPSWALTTIFQMRYARTVFPCLDHPSLKANFSICVQHPTDTLAASNMDVRTSTTTEDGQQLECFETTPAIPTYVATVSLMGGFTQLTDSASSPKLDLFYSSSETNDTFLWEFEKTRNVLNLLQDTYGLAKYDSKKLGLLNVNPAPFWGVENYGLVTLESGFTRFLDTERGQTILVHELIHQWLGDTTTVARWHEICLQEGLTAYLEMLLSEQLKITKTPIGQQIRNIIYEYLSKDHSVPLIRQYNVTQDIADHCFGKPVVFLHSIAYGYGSDVWYTFLTKLVEKYGRGNAGLEEWVKLLNELTGSEKAGELLKMWFTENGYPIFYVSTLKDNKIQLKQKIHLNELSRDVVRTKPFTPSKARLTPLRVLSGQTTTSVVLIDSVDQIIEIKKAESDSNSDWVVVDPDSATFSRRLYTVDNYLSLLDCFYNAEKKDACKLKIDQVQDVFTDFCFGMTENEIPWGNDPGSVESWNAIFDQLATLTSNASGRKELQVRKTCECCFRSKQELLNEKYGPNHPNACKAIWNQECRSLSLIKSIGRDYEIPA